MIKKFLFFFLLVIMFPLAAQAISLKELQNNPTKYVLVSTEEVFSVYVDAESAEVVRQDPPYYTIKGTFYEADFLASKIIRNRFSLSYDYQKSYQKQWEAARKALPDQSDQLIRALVDSAQSKDPGITLNDVYVMNYYFSGEPKFKKELYTPNHRDSPLNPRGVYGLVAEYFFYKCYHIPFTQMFDLDFPKKS